ncbi:helix-turn-helix domain-containing protein, partial [Streptomyces cirratus]
LLGHRLDAARRLLERTDHPVPEVARRTGFASEVTFRQHFTAYVGQSPRAYRAAAAAIPNHRDSVRNGS